MQPPVMPTGNMPVDPIEELLKAKGNQSELRELIKEFLNSSEIQGKTDLNDAQIELFWVCDIFNARYPGLGFDSLGEKFMHLRISRNGSSRKAVVEMLRGMGGGQQLPPNGAQQGLDLTRRF